MIFDGKKKKLLGAYAGKDVNGDYLFILSSNDSSNRCRLTLLHQLCGVFSFFFRYLLTLPLAIIVHACKG